MNKIFRDADKAKGPVYKLPGPQMQCRGYSTHSIEEILFSDQECCVAL